MLTSYNGVIISSDLSGNPLNWRNASSMTWSGRKLTGLTLTDNTAVTYSYNSDGIRTEKTAGTRHTEYLLDGTKVLKQITTDISDNDYYEQILFYYDTNEELVGFSYLGHDYWYGKDINGVIRYIYNENGEMCAEYTYDAWGRVISSSNLNGGTVANINPFRYKDYYYDTETGFYYLQSRYYDPTVARFISADSVDYLGASGSVLSYNLFAYCENEPVKNSDVGGNLLRKESISSSITSNYSPEDAVKYAKRWWCSRNDKYYWYSSDCANFVSQCLYAGGIKMNNEWHSYRIRTIISFFTWNYRFFVRNYTYKWDVTDSWRLAPKNFEYFSNISNGFTRYDYLKITTADDLKKCVSQNKINAGDIVYFIKNGKVYHAGLIVKTNTKTAYFSAHTTNRNSYDLKKKIGEGVYVVRMT